MECYHLSLWISHLFSLTNGGFGAIVRRQFTETIMALMELMIKCWLVFKADHELCLILHFPCQR